MNNASDTQLLLPMDLPAGAQTAPLKNTAVKNKEAVGKKFSLAAMQHAAAQTMCAVEAIAKHIKPGMTEGEAVQLADSIIFDMGAERTWHRSTVRFGANTLKTFRHRGNPASVLKENDIFFIDLGVVWDKHEGDAGASFTVGDDAEMQACAAAAKTLWHTVSAHWQQHRISGQALYDFADQATRDLGYELRPDIKGHRVSDFPHAIYRAGDLGDFENCPNVGLWILEIQIQHKSGLYGAFYEDLL